MHIMWEDLCLLKAGLATGVAGFKVQTALWQGKADWAGGDFTWEGTPPGHSETFLCSP